MLNGFDVVAILIVAVALVAITFFITACITDSIRNVWTAISAVVNRVLTAESEKLVAAKEARVARQKALNSLFDVTDMLVRGKPSEANCEQEAEAAAPEVQPVEGEKDTRGATDCCPLRGVLVVPPSLAETK